MTKAIPSSSLEESLLDYERVHARYMNTVVGSETFADVKHELAMAREKYLAEMQKEHPTWICL